MELSARERDSLSVAPWLEADELHALPLLEDDVLATSLANAPMLDHDDVNALFPLLGDSSLECEGDQAFEGDPEQPPFDSDLSPIFAAKPAPLGTMARRRSAAAAAATATATTTATATATTGTGGGKRSRSRALSLKSADAARSAWRALAPVNQDAVVASSPDAAARRAKRRHSFLTPVRSDPAARASSHNSSSTGGSLPKRKRTAASEPALVSSVWTEQEQSVFFSTFKTKWPVDDRVSAVASASASALSGAVQRAPSFSTLLLQRFDAISKRVKTKSVLEVRQFYTVVLGSISVLLREVEHDVNLTNPDQVRIAVWCWSKLLTDDIHKNDFQRIGTADSATKRRLAHLLLQTIIRSRRQMLKAKSFAGGVYTGVSFFSATPPPAVHESPSQPSGRRASSPSPAPDSAVAEPRSDSVAPAREAAVVHHPMVRKKHAVKRVRTDSDARAEAPSGAVDETPLKLKRPHPEVAFASPAPTQFHVVAPLRPQHQQQQEQPAPTHMTSHTPPRSSKKKMFIKMRIVPLDESAKAHVARAGCNPKVELKLTATKKISEVAQHMADKWGHVRAFVPADARLQFYEQQQPKAADSHDSDAESAGDARNRCWSASDRTVTCFDIWKRSGKQVKDENVVVVYYSWARPETVMPSDGASDALARSSGRLFAEEMSLADLSAASATASSAVSSTRGLQQFGESLAFHSGEFFGARDGRSSACKQQTKTTTTTTTTGATCPLEALLDENDDDDADAAPLVDCSPNTQRRRRRITPVLVPTQEFDL